MRRVACIALPEVRLEVAREKEREGTRESGSAAAMRGGARSPRGLEWLADWRPEPAQIALAVVVARPGSAVQTERDVLGNTRLDVVSREARALGVRAGQTVAAARAKCGDLRVRVVHEGAVQTALARVAEAALAFGPASGFDVAHGVVWVDVTGCAHLHDDDAAGDDSAADDDSAAGNDSAAGDDNAADDKKAKTPLRGTPPSKARDHAGMTAAKDYANELALATALEARVEALGHACRVAIANGPRIAMAVASCGPVSCGTLRVPSTTPVAEPPPALPGGKRLSQGERRGAEDRRLGWGGAGPIVVPPGSEAAAMRGLPIAALSGAVGLDDETAAWLRDLGLVRCGDLQKLPRKSLGVRLGDRVRDVMLLLDGEDRAPFVAWRPPEVPEERVELEWGAASLEALAFVLKTLCDRLAARLQGRALGAARLELVLSLDRALCDDGAHRSAFEIVLPVPLAGAADLLAVVRSRLEHVTLAAPVLMATLRATELARMEGRTVSLIEPEPVAGRAMPRLVAELSAELGAPRVGVLELVDTWHPDERTRLAPYGSRPPSARVPLTMSALEPTRIVPARPIDGASMQQVPLLRVEGIEWWRRPPRRRDFAAAWIAGGGAAGDAGWAGALAWVENGDASRGDATLHGWMD